MFRPGQYTSEPPNRKPDMEIKLAGLVMREKIATFMEEMAKGNDVMAYPPGDKYLVHRNDISGMFRMLAGNIRKIEL